MAIESDSSKAIVSTSTPGFETVPLPAPERNDYLQNIQLDLIQANNGAAPVFEILSTKNSGVKVGNQIYIEGPVIEEYEKENDKNKIPKEPSEPIPNLIKEPVKGFKAIWRRITSKSGLRYLLAIMTAAILVTTIVSIVFLLTNDETNLDDLQIVSRKEWFAKQPKEESIPLQHPIPLVIIQHTATESCSDSKSCISSTQAVESFHVDSRGWDDIGYNFLIGGDGRVYEGRGWNNVGAHTLGYNRCGLGVSFIGLYNSIYPNKKQLSAASNLIKLGVQKGFIDTNYKLMGARQLSPTLSPGDALFSLVEKMDHFSTVVDDKC